MKPYYQDNLIALYNKDCKDMSELPDNSVDLVVTDPPYGYSFMGKDWDKAVIPVDIWKECFRVLKSGAFAFVMCSPRQDCLGKMICNLSDAGFETGFTSLYWAYASGFPKAQNIGKAVDKKRVGDKFWELRQYLKSCIAQSGLTQTQIKQHLGYPLNSGVIGHWIGQSQPCTPSGKDWQKLKEILSLDDRYDGLIFEAEREIVGKAECGDPARWYAGGISSKLEYDITAPATPQAKALDGSYGGFQPKPALECILCAQKPLTLEAECSIITSQALKLLEVIIECTDVNTVVKNTLGDMASIVQEHVTVKSIEGARAQIGKVGGQYELTAMLESILAKMEKDIALMHWNTGLLWKSILVEVLNQMSKFTISMATELIIELKTLNSLIFANIQENTTIQEKTQQSGLRLNVGIVESILASVLTKLLSLNHTTVPTNATLNMHTAKQDIPVKDAGKNLLQTIPSGNTAHLNATGNIDTRVILVVMKPLSEKTFVDQALKNRHGITWLDDGRIPLQGIEEHKTEAKSGLGKAIYGGYQNEPLELSALPRYNNKGRFPANLLVSNDVLNDGREHTSGAMNSIAKQAQYNTYGQMYERQVVNAPSSGSFSRFFDLDKWFKTFPFFIVPKASKGEKNKGCENLPTQLKLNPMRSANGTGEKNFEGGFPDVPMKNYHSTVKPLKLMSYLITLGSREGDTILDNFVGSGTTLLAAKLTGRKAKGYEIKREYCEISMARCRQLILEM